MRYKPSIINKTMIFNLYKPIYNTTYAVWDKWLKIAKEKKLKIIIKTKQGKAFFDNVNQYLKYAIKIKRYYKRKDEPMIFYKIDILPFIEKEPSEGEYLKNFLTKLKEEKPREYEKLGKQLKLI